MSFESCDSKLRVIGRLDVTAPRSRPHQTPTLHSRRGWIELWSFVHMLNGCPEMSQHVPKYVPKCFEMAIRHTNVPGLVGQFASIDGPPEWFPDWILEIFVLLMSRNVPKCPKNTKVSCPETSQNVPNIVGMSQNWKRDSASLLCL